MKFSPRSVSAAVLAVLLLAAATLSVSHALHQSLHSNGQASDLCLICSLAKGQVSAADPAPALAIYVSILCLLIALVRQALPSSSDRRLAPSRAPPALFSVS